MDLQNFFGECPPKEWVPSYSKGKSQQQGLGTTFLLVTGSAAGGQCHSQQDGLTLGKIARLG